MRGYKRKMRSHGEVELNMAAMLDMAFQLLAFFILTFRPSPVEAQLSLRMPPAKGTGGSIVDPSSIKEDLTKGEQLPMVVHADGNGEISRIDLGNTSIPAQQGTEQALATLNAALRERIQQADYGGVELKVSQNLLYERLMQVVDVCTQQQLKSGEQLTQVSISEIGAGQ
jgi:biopolymer transport protein ExbD